MRFAIVNTSFKGVHCWEGCNKKKVDFLKNKHHHEFGVSVKLEQFHDDRDIEYITFQGLLNRLLKSLPFDLGNKSCEMIATHIGKWIDGAYPGRLYSVEVNEDGHYGAIIENNKHDLLWLAGFIDGEGTITAPHQKSRKKPFYTPVLSIANTDYTAVERCVEIIKKYTCEEKRILVYEHKDKTHWKPRYTVQLSKKTLVKRILQLLMPYLVIKREQAENILKFIETGDENYAKRTRELNQT